MAGIEEALLAFGDELASPLSVDLLGPRECHAAGDGQLEASYLPGQDQPTRPEDRSQEPTGTLFAIWGSGPADVWAAGEYGRVIRWNGSAWTSVLIPAHDYISSIWGSSPDDIWAVGGDTIFHWNGTAWTASLTEKYIRSALIGLGKRTE